MIQQRAGKVVDGGKEEQPTSARRVDDFDSRRIADHLETDIRGASPYSSTELVEVVFNETVNKDTVIRHALNPTEPEGVKWEVVSLELMTAPSTVPVIYRDSSSTHRPWKPDYIILRSNVASLKVTLLLGVPRA